MTTVRFTFAALAALAALAIATSACAQDHARRRPRVIEIGPTVIEGHRQIPLAILLTRARVDFSTPELQTSFVREIVRTPAPTAH